MMTMTNLSPRALVWLVLAGLGMAGILGTEAEPQDRQAALAEQPSVRAGYRSLPLGFEPNVGQTAPEAQFLARGGGYQLFLASDRAILSLKTKPVPAQRASEFGIPRVAEGSRHAVELRFAGARQDVRLRPESPQRGVSNYLVGRDAARWRTGVPHFERVRAEQLYPGVDVVYYGNSGRLEYDCEVAPGASPGAIRLRIDGVDGSSIREDGAIRLRVGDREFVQQAPISYQELNGVRVPVESRYVRLAANEFGFEVGDYDRSRRLIIDPVLCWSTFLGGSGVDEGCGIAVDEDHNVYVTGFTDSVDFPIVLGAYQPGHAGATDIFVTKLNEDGTALIYSTFIGGSGIDIGNAIALDSDRNAYITGVTSSRDFPIASPLGVQPAQSVYGGGDGDVFVTKLDANGAGLHYSTYLGGGPVNKGGNGLDIGYGIDVDAAGNCYVAGGTGSPMFPTRNAVQPFWAAGIDAFVTMLDTVGEIDFSTFHGGGVNEYNGHTDYGSGDDVAYDVAVDRFGQVHICGCTGTKLNFPLYNALQSRNRSIRESVQEAFVAKLISGGKQYIYSTYIGGNNDECARGIALDAGGNAYITGVTRSTNFPTWKPLRGTTGGGDDIFVTRINAAGFRLDWSTYLGGSNNDEGLAIALDHEGSIYVTGRTESADFPNARAIRGDFGGLYDGILVKLRNDGRALFYSAYFGSNDLDAGKAIAVGSLKDAHVTGYTNGQTFPVTEGVVQPTFGGGIRDAFVLKVTDTLELVAGGKMRIPASVKLKPTPLGQTVSKFFEIENLSEKKILTGEVGTLTAPFTVDSNGGRFAIQPGKSRRVRIKFTADRLGIITQVLRVTSSDPRAGEVFVLIRGEGLPDR